MIRNVACGISGGVDSAIAAYFLKKNFNVIGVFMTNWDVKDETSECNVNKDREDAKYICNHLKIPFTEVNFVKEYWNNVFENTICSYERGMTPNPDIMCNKYIKFNKFAKHCLHNLKVDAFATGHYARSSLGTQLNMSGHHDVPILRRPVDRVKDQTFWLCQVDLKFLAKCIFPLSDITKPEVKKIAQEIGLEKISSRKESMGICFIGKRKFRNFIDYYIEPKSGIFTLLETGRLVGEHKGVHHFTLGQKAGLSVGQNGAYIAKLDPNTQEIKVVLDRNHPALFMKTVVTEAPHWLGGDPLLQGVARLRLQYQNKYRSIACTVHRLTDRSGLSVRLDEWFRCLSPGQYAVFYSMDDETCLGSAQILSSLSAYEEGVTENLEWDSRDFENHYIYQTGCK